MTNRLSAPFSQVLLENIFSGQILTGFDCTQLATMILTPTQRLLWKVKWAELCDLAALRNLDRPEGDPRYMITTAQMMGTGDFADVNRQARLPVEVLQESASLALKAMVTLPEAGKPQQSFTSIRQGNKEPYMSFIDRLRDAIEKQIDNADAKEALIITWGRGYACVITENGPKWIPTKWTKPYAEIDMEHTDCSKQHDSDTGD
ncbi:endogenous retrovirus group K member 8 Gag polyprotein-like [Aquila chrysaetos chrysaetos]|uniref:endogenous retrovirus group K member 8 Gag polyprotein-like n=1 Tax=Aquila chrysaetos chrysaetos TaxID=223781 RepID=UPI001B7D2F99|nr:endogenous retrovirus group K member 8 Gag polyprotein-like [Aquila chrysaetos chrysaetos]